MNINDAFHGISTLIISTAAEGQAQGTGFFYHEFKPEREDKHATEKERWRAIEKLWLVTNRHVLLPKVGDREIVPETLTFHMRKLDSDRIVWDPITLRKKELLERARFHQNADVDVCIVYVLDMLMEKVKGDESYLQWFSLSRENLPGQNKINVEVADDAVVIGYPRGFYDQTNVYPIVKSGIVASRFGAHFNGRPYFLIDAKLFPGSSGSVVVSKPTNIVVAEQKVFYNTDKQFAFLGIYSGEPFQEHRPIEFEDITIIRKSGFNLGTVWYGFLVEEIINDGCSYSESEDGS